MVKDNKYIEAQISELCVCGLQLPVLCPWDVADQLASSASAASILLIVDLRSRRQLGQRLGWGDASTGGRNLCPAESEPEK